MADGLKQGMVHYGHNNDVTFLILGALTEAVSSS